MYIEISEMKVTINVSNLDSKLENSTNTLEDKLENVRKNTSSLHGNLVRYFGIVTEKISYHKI